MSPSNLRIPMPVDVVSDVVCPWCFVGKRRLEKAMALVPDIPLTVRWRPYFLNPWVPREGIGRDEYLTTKFGSVAGYERIARPIVAAAEAEGLVYVLDAIARQPNTLDCHRLIRWAGDSAGRMKQRLMELYFSEGADLTQRGADVIVWPESSYPFAIDRDQPADLPPSHRARVRRGFDTPLLFGTVTIGDRRVEPYPFNTALMLDAEGRFTARFDKNFLLVFGEYIPFYERMKWVQTLIPEASNFARGDSVTTFPLEVPRLGDRGHVKLGPMICYEDIIPSFGRRLVAQRPNLLVNITNDAWFGATSEPYEHLALAVFRAVEHRLDLVRAVNTGVSAFVDATGRVYEKGPAVDPQLTPDVKPVALLQPMAVMEASGPYGALGDLFGVLNLLAVLGLALPLAMLALPAWQGLIQRAMYAAFFAWLWAAYPGRVR